MNSFSGLSAILTVSLVALLTVQLLKDKFEMVENYGDQDDNGHSMNNNMDYMQPYTTRYVPPDTNQNVREVVEALPVHAKNLNDLPGHGTTPFVTGDFFSTPYVAPNSGANGWNGFPEAFAMYQQQLSNATPTVDSLNLIGSGTLNLPGPNAWSEDSFAQANVNNGRAGNISLCAQNMKTSALGNFAVSSSLLPDPHDKDGLEGFSDCNTTDPLSNQVFLGAAQQIGADTISNSLKNSNQSLRSEPPNPVLAVGPWNLSTIYPDLTRRPLEGCGPSFGLYGNGPFGSGTPTTIAP
jgi:hypothetical protein